MEEAEGSDSEPMLEDNVGRRALQRQRQRQAARAGAIPTNARVCVIFFCEFFCEFEHEIEDIF